MRKRLSLLLLALLLGLPLRADDAPLVVVSARQYFVKGDSTIHLYLYGMDGKLRKQLTNNPGQDDHAPVFSHDGKSIFFTRTTTGTGAPNQSGKYTLTLADGAITRATCDPAPPDFSPTIDITEYGELAFSNEHPGDPYTAGGDDAMSFRSPDKSTTLIQLPSSSDEIPPSYELRINDNKAQPITRFTGYQPLPENIGGDQFLASKTGPFLTGPGNYGALFVNRHRDSMWAFDVHRKTWHEIQTEWVPGDIFAPRDKSGFYFVRCSMEPLGDTGKTVLTAYLEWWNACFERVILSPPLSVTYGAAIWYGNSETAVIVDEQRGS